MSCFVGHPLSAYVNFSLKILNFFFIVSERMSAERLAVERMALATDPLVRLQMAGINPEVIFFLIK